MGKRRHEFTRFGEVRSVEYVFTHMKWSCFHSFCQYFLKADLMSGVGQVCMNLGNSSCATYIG